MKSTSYIAPGKAPNTVRAYESDWRDFARWCYRYGLCALPAAPTTVARYIGDLAEFMKVSTVTRRLSAIAKGHAAERYESPCSLRHAAVAEVLADIKRRKGALTKSKSPLMTDDLRNMIDALPKTVLGTRDAALLLTGFAGGFQRSELAGLNVGDVEDTGDGLRILLRRSKIEQEGVGRIVSIPFGSNPTTCPVRRYRNWLEISGVTVGAVFRRVDRYGNIGDKAITPQVVTLAVKRACERVGLDPTRFGAHSLRSGMVTQSARNGASEASIMRHTGHRSIAMVRRCIYEGEWFQDNAAAKLGL